MLIPARYRRRSAIAPLALTGALLLAGCGEEPQSPEAQVRARIARAVEAAEARDVGTLRDMVSDRYGDSNGRDKRAIEAMLRLHFLPNESVHLYTRVQSVTAPHPDRADASVLVAMAGVPIASEVELPALRADLHRIDHSTPAFVSHLKRYCYGHWYRVQFLKVSFRSVLSTIK